MEVKWLLSDFNGAPLSVMEHSQRFRKDSARIVGWNLEEKAMYLTSGVFQALGGMRAASEGLLGARGLSAREAISGSTKL